MARPPQWLASDRGVPHERAGGRVEAGEGVVQQAERGTAVDGARQAYAQPLAPCEHIIMTPVTPVFKGKLHLVQPK